MIHPRQAEIATAAQERLLRHVHGLDPSTAAVAEMSKAKADGAFGTALEAVLREAVTRFDPTALVAETLEAMGHGDGPTGAGAGDGQA